MNKIIDGNPKETVEQIRQQNMTTEEEWSEEMGADQS